MTPCGTSVRTASPADIPAIIEIERSSASAAHWPEPAYSALFSADAPRIVLVAEDEHRQLCGFLVARIVADECELENVVVEPREMRRGIGSALLEHLIRTACEQGIGRILLEVRETNCAARKLYEKFGFAQDGGRKTYYRNPKENAVLYSLLVSHDVKE